MGLVDHEVRSLNVQDGLVLGDGGQVFVAQHLVVHLGHDVGGRAGYTGVSGGADAPRGGKRLLLQTFHAAATGRPLPRKPVRTWRGQTSGSARLLQRGLHNALWCPHPLGLSALLTAGGSSQTVGPRLSEAPRGKGPRPWSTGFRRFLRNLGKRQLLQEPSRALAKHKITGRKLA